MARLAVSNIAWTADDDQDVFQILSQNRLCLELAPTRIWDSWAGASAVNAAQVKSSFPCPVVSMQSLLFQKPDLKLFENGPEGRQNLLEHLKLVVDIAHSLTTPGPKCALVFGSPKNRIKGKLTSNEAIEIAVEFFRQIGAYANDKNVLICLEPNPSAYGADFMTTAFETSAVVRAVQLTSVALSLDSGCAHLAEEDISKCILENADILGHFQISEPQLASFKSPCASHRRAAEALASVGYSKIISIEMRSSGKESVANLREAIAFVKKAYKNCLFVPLKVAVIGGGWFGCHLASSLIRSGHAVQIFEAHNELLRASSSNNQFRLHLGFHYPRSFNTRRNMQMHFLRFERDYPDLTENVSRNFYGIAKECSTVDFGTFLAVMSSMGLPFKVHNPSEHGFTNLEGLITCSERVFKRDLPTKFFGDILSKVTHFNTHVKECEIVQTSTNSVSLRNESFDWILNCSYNQFMADSERSSFYELCLTFTYLDTMPFEPEIALTVMDGQLASMYPLKEEDGRRKITLTSVKHTPVMKSTNLSELLELSTSAKMQQIIIERRPLFEQCISEYYPKFSTRYSYHGYFISYKTKPIDGSDNRECFVSVQDRIINVWSGKINAIYDAETRVNEIMDAGIKQRIGTSAALIGFTGFVGATLNRQGEFTDLYNSKNIESIRGRTFDVVFCAGAPGVKWKANKNPEEDVRSIQVLIECLRGIRTKQFVLISTIDVYPVFSGQAEEFPCKADQGSHHAYGRNRQYLEEFVLNHFEEALIVRLPALFGGGLRKNYLFDLLSCNNIHSIDPNTVFQWYDTADLLNDITTVMARNIHLDPSKRLKIVNLFTEPIRTSDIIDKFFPIHASFTLPRTLQTNVCYDLWTSYGTLFACSTQHYARTSADILEKMSLFISRWRAHQSDHLD